MKNITGIYKIINSINGKMYIGSAFLLRKRKYEHFKMLSDGNHFNRHLQNAYDKYGKENFTFEIIETCKKKDVRNREHHWIEQYDFEKELYNIVPSPNTYHTITRTDEYRRKMSKIKTGTIFTEEHKQKISRTHIKRGISVGEKNPFYGKTHTKETRELFSRLHKGKTISKEQRKAISLRVSGEKNPNYGKKSVNRRKVAQIDIESGEVLQVHDCLLHAAESVGQKYSSGIVRCASGKYKACAGYKWEYLD